MYRRRTITALVFLLGYVVPAVCEANTSIPGPASKAGFLLRTFYSTFNDDVDILDKRESGMNWYRGKWFGWPSSLAKTILKKQDGIELLNNEDVLSLRGTLNYSIASAAPMKGSGEKEFVGKSFGNGGYFEAEIKFDATSVNKEGAQGFPAWWLEPLEHLRQPRSHWEGQNRDYEHFVEIDVFEYNQFRKNPPNVYSAAVHEWFGVYNKTCPPTFCQVTNYNGKTDFMNYIVALDKNTDFSRFHKYGVLWSPATDGKKGVLQYYFDGIPVSTPLTWDKYRDEAPPPRKDALDIWYNGPPALCSDSWDWVQSADDHSLGFCLADQ